MKATIDFLEFGVSQKRFRSKNSTNQKKKKKKYTKQKKLFSKNPLKYKSSDSFFPEKWLINQTSLDLDRNIRFSRYLDDSQELHTRRRSVELIQRDSMPEENRDNLRGGKWCRGRASGHYFRTLSEKLGNRSRKLDWTRDA